MLIIICVSVCACESEERHYMPKCSVCLCVRVCGRRVCFAAKGHDARFTSRAEFVVKANEKRKQTEANVELLVASALYELMYIDNNG